MATWNGPGHWRSYADTVQPGYSHPDYDPETSGAATVASKHATMEMATTQNVNNPNQTLYRYTCSEHPDWRMAATTNPVEAQQRAIEHEDEHSMSADELAAHRRANDPFAQFENQDDFGF